MQVFASSNERRRGCLLAVANRDGGHVAPIAGTNGAQLRAALLQALDVPAKAKHDDW